MTHWKRTPFALVAVLNACGGGQTYDDGTDGLIRSIGGSLPTGTSSRGSGSPTVEPGVCDDGAATYRATAKVIDIGLGPTGAPVTIENCSDQVAYVRRDCCHGAAFVLERKDRFGDEPWRTSAPRTLCDCEGLDEPLAIEPGGQVVVETNPSFYDSEPLCVGSFAAVYRWTFMVGNEAECDDCWQSVPTNDINWYCEG